MTAVRCPHCNRSCAGPAGLASHIRSMHPEQIEDTPPLSPPTPRVELLWEDPPPRARDPWALALINPVLLELRANPNRWARLYTWRDAKRATAAKAQLAKRPEVADIEFSARSLPDGTSALYGRTTDVLTTAP